MSPPIDIDGSEIQEATIDGQDVKEITIDGQQAAEFIDPPDISMFSSPLYQFWAGDLSVPDGTSPVDFPEVLAGLSDATAENSPTFRSDKSGFGVIEYDGTDDYHNWSPDSQIPTADDAFSIAATVNLKSNSDERRIISWGGDSTDQKNAFATNSNGKIQHAFFANDIAGSSTVPTNQFVTLGVRYDGANRKLYFNGAGDGSDSAGAVNVQNTNHEIAHWSTTNQPPFNGFISEIVVSTAAESDQAFSDYHQNRLG